MKQKHTHTHYHVHESRTGGATSEQATEILARLEYLMANVDELLNELAEANLATNEIAADIDALLAFAESRELLTALPAAWVDQLDAALQDLDLEAAHRLCEDMLQQLAGQDVAA